MNMPNRYLQVIYKQYVDTIMDKAKSEAHANEEASEQLEEAMTGGM